MPEIELQPTRCAICKTARNAVELYPANFDANAFNPAVFSARRLPDRVHYRLVRCRSCGLVRSDPVAPTDILASLYSQSSLDYSSEILNLRLTYGHYLARLTDHGCKKGALLEVGCGNGFLLEEAIARGFAIVRGVEPSSAAVAAANPEMRSNIICDIMRPGLFEPHQFDAVCLFQVLDHIPDPNAFLDECWQVLKPGGMILCLNHNIEAVFARLLQDRCPIIDIEHTYLYSPSTLSCLLKAHGFEIRALGSVRNRYTLHYLARLVPLPSTLKRPIVAFLGRCPVGQVRLSVPLGNLYVIAQKPS